MTSPSGTLPEPGAEPHSVRFTLAAIALVVLMLALCAAYGLGLLVQHLSARGAGGDNAAMVTRTLVGRQLIIPSAWLHGTGEGGQGFASQIELEAQLPLGKGGAEAAIEVTLLPLSQVRTSADMLDGVYLHQFRPDTLSGPPGLVGKPLYATEGYDGETVWYDALSQNPFVAKCMAPVARGTPTRCIRFFSLTGGIAAIYTFDGGVLDQWQGFDSAMSQWLGRIGAS